MKITLLQKVHEFPAPCTVQGTNVIGMAGFRAPDTFRMS